MISITKTFSVDMAHKLCTDYETPCLRTHGHTYTINLHLSRKDPLCPVDRNGMVLDFKHLKYIFDEAIKKDFDHMMVLYGQDPCLGELKRILPDQITVIDCNPTAENFAVIFYERMNAALKKHCSEVECFQVDVFETAGNMATYFG